MFFLEKSGGEIILATGFDEKPPGKECSGRLGVCSILKQSFRFVLGVGFFSMSADWHTLG